MVNLPHALLYEPLLPCDKHSKYFSIVAGCGGIINADEGNITSPNYPNKYDQNLDCEWRIITSPGSRVMVYIDDLNIVDTARYSCNRSQVLYEKPVLKNFANFTGLPIFMATVWNFNKKRLRHNFSDYWGTFRRKLRSFSEQPFCCDCIQRYKYMRRLTRFGTVCTIKEKVKSTHGGVLLLGNFTKSSTPPWVFFTFFKLYKWCQIAQSITYRLH